MSDLFEIGKQDGQQPLAAVLRPRALDEVVGQAAITGKGSILRRRIEAGQLGSIVLYGPPGVGKTTIARVVGEMLGKGFRQLHATRAGVRDIRQIADEARMNPLLIFIDEVHRFSATQADDLLAICEEGTADFIGATTQNPYTALPKALVSRSTILKLDPISLDDMIGVIDRGLAHLAQNRIDVALSEEHKRLIAGRSGGDARRALTTLESLAVGHARGKSVKITDQMIEEAYQSAPVNHDRSGDQHYDIISHLTLQNVILVLDRGAIHMLDKTLLYTGATRAQKKLLVCCEDMDLIQHAVDRGSIALQRKTNLLQPPERGLLSWPEFDPRLSRTPSKDFMCLFMGKMNGAKHEPV